MASNPLTNDHMGMNRSVLHERLWIIE